MTTPPVGWGPVVDSRGAAAARVYDPAAPASAANIPLLVGNTYAEMGGGINNPSAAELTLDQLRTELQPLLGARTNDAVAAYQKVFPKAQPFEIWGVIQGTRSYRLNASPRPTSSPRSRHPSTCSGSAGDAGARRPAAAYALSGSRVLVRQHRSGGAGNRRNRDARALAAQMSGALVAFAKTGKPAHAGLAEWPAYTPATRPTMVFENERASVKNDPDKEARALVAG